jgi:hypothetical protein
MRSKPALLAASWIMTTVPCGMSGLWSSSTSLRLPLAIQPFNATMISSLSVGTRLGLAYFLARLWTMRTVLDPAVDLNSVGRFFPSGSKHTFSVSPSIS